MEPFACPLEVAIASWYPSRGDCMKSWTKWSKENWIGLCPGFQTDEAFKFIAKRAFRKSSFPCSFDTLNTRAFNGSCIYMAFALWKRTTCRKVRSAALIAACLQLFSKMLIHHSHDILCVHPGAYFHPKFVRENRSLCNDIVRVKTESVNNKRAKAKRRPRKPKPSTAQQQQHHQLQQTTQHPESCLNHPATVTTSVSSSALTGYQTQGFTSLSSANFDSIPNQYSLGLLMYSEDIIGLFGDGL